MKRDITKTRMYMCAVAPCAGAWIETIYLI